MPGGAGAHQGTYYDPNQDESDSDGECAAHAVSCSWLTQEPELEATGASVHTAASVPPVPDESSTRAELLIDSGASIHLFQTEAMRKVATVVDASSPLGHINGVGGRSPVTALLGAHLHLKGGVRISVKAPFAAAAEGAGATAQDI